MNYDVDLAIIGAGSAGLLAAEVAPKLAVKAALIERSRLGGDCLWTGCVPSKALLASAKAAHTIRHADKYGLPATDLQIDTAQVWRRMRDIQDDIAATDDSPDKYRQLGVEVIFGEAMIEDAHSVRVAERTLTARYILLCTGSRPAVPPIEGLEETGFLTSESLFSLERAPRSLIIMGAGPIGVEMAQAMNRLGVETTLLEQAGRILERDEPSLSALLLEQLRDEGVDVRLNCREHRAGRQDGNKILSARIDGQEHTVCAEEIFIATGRKANVGSLGLESVGVKTGPRGVIVDKNLRSSVPSIYAVGDTAGRYLFTHSAGVEAITALRNMFYPGAKSAPDLIPWATFSDPELAHVGMTSEEATDAHGADRIRVYDWDLQRNDRARVESAPKGKIVVITDTKFKILGAHILAPAASEMIGQFTLAIDRGVPLTPAFRDLVQIYPTFSISFAQLTEEAVYEQLARQPYRALRRLNDLMGG